jgi:hypothetical protein
MTIIDRHVAICYTAFDGWFDVRIDVDARITRIRKARKGDGKYEVAD